LTWGSVPVDDTPPSNVWTGGEKQISTVDAHLVDAVIGILSVGTINRRRRS
jgi:hypothetical protein